MEEHNTLLEQEKREAERLISVRPLTRDNAVFHRTEGGFVNLDYTDPEGETKTYTRGAVHRCFPFSDPDHYISIRESTGDGREIGLVENLDDLPEEAREMLQEQMALRYFVPKIRKIRSIKEEYGYSYWDADTDRGSIRFTVRMGGGSVYAIGEGRYLVNDIDGNRFEIPDVKQLTAKELRELDLFI